MYLKNFEIRWSDIDANRHLANSAYINFMSHTRLSCLVEHSIGIKEMLRHNMGPVVFYEHMYYFREVFAEKPVQVSLQLMGLSADGMYFEFLHNFYDGEGKNFASCEMMGSWIDLNTRKLRGLPEELYNNFAAIQRTDDFKVLTKEDTRKFSKHPKHLP